MIQTSDHHPVLLALAVVLVFCFSAASAPGQGTQDFPSPPATYVYQILEFDIVPLVTDEKGDLTAKYVEIRDKAKQVVADASRFDLTKKNEFEAYGRYIGKQLAMTQGQSVPLLINDKAGKELFWGQLKATTPEKLEFLPEIHELTADEAKKFPAGKDKAHSCQTGNLFDNKTNQLLIGLEETKKWREITSKLDFARPEHRTRTVKVFIEGVGEQRARRIGLRFYDAEGQAKYVWPAP